MSDVEYMPHNCEWNVWIAEHDKQIRADAITEIEKAMHEAYKGTSHRWECMIFDLKIRELKEQTE